MTRIARLGLAVLLAAAGCRTAVPVALPLPADDPRVPVLLESLARRADRVRSVRGTARVSLEGQGSASFARQLVLLERPASLRVEVLGLLNQRMLVLATDGTRYQLYRAGEAELESGEVRPSVLLEVAGLPLTPEEAVSVLLGGPPPPPPNTTARAFLQAGSDGVRLDLDGSPGALRQSLEFDGAGNLRHYRLEARDGALLADVRYDDFRAVQGTPFAHAIALDFPATQTSAEVSFRSVEINPELPRALFQLDVPDRG